MPGLSESEIDRLALSYRDEYIRNSESIPLFANVARGLEQLHQEGFLLAVATSKSRRGLDRSLARHGMQDMFHSTRTAEETHDLKMAQQAGIAYAGMTHGAHTGEKQRAVGARQLFDSFKELQEYLRTVGLPAEK